MSTTRWARDAVSGTVAFTDVLRANQSMVFSIAVHFLRDRALAEEIAQDVFLELHRHMNELESPEHAANWLRKVTSRRCIDAARKRKIRFAVALEAAPEPAAQQHAEDPMLRDRLRKLVAALPERARIVTVLRYQEDLMPEEIARILGMPVRTVKSHLQRSIALLRGKFERLKGEVRHG